MQELINFLQSKNRVCFLNTKVYNMYITIMGVFTCLSVMEEPL